METVQITIKTTDGNSITSSA